MKKKEFRKELRRVVKNLESILRGEESSDIVTKVVKDRVVYLSAEGITDSDLAACYALVSGGYRKTFYNALIDMIASITPSTSLKRRLYQKILGYVGKGVIISPGARMDFLQPKLIKIYDNAVIGINARVYAHALCKDKLKLGTVYLGENSLLGANSVMTPGSSLGKNTKTGMNCFINRVVGENCVIGPRTVINSDVGDNTSIGLGAIINARVGHNCVIGSGAQVHSLLHDYSVVKPGHVYA